MAPAAGSAPSFEIVDPDVARHGVHRRRRGVAEHPAQGDDDARMHLHRRGAGRLRQEQPGDVSRRLTHIPAASPAAEGKVAKQMDAQDLASRHRICMFGDDRHLYRQLEAVGAPLGWAIRCCLTLEAIEGAPWDPATRSVAVLALGREGAEAPTLVNRLARATSVPVIAVGYDATAAAAVAALKAGAVDYLPRPVVNPDLATAVLDALAAAEAAPHLSKLVELASRFPSLTDREHEVLGLLIQGLTSKGIARRLASLRAPSRCIVDA